MNIIELTNNKLSFDEKEINILLDKDNIPWFKGKDIANILGYSNTSKM